MHMRQVYKLKARQGLLECNERHKFADKYSSYKVMSYVVMAHIVMAYIVMPRLAGVP